MNYDHSNIVKNGDNQVDEKHTKSGSQFVFIFLKNTWNILMNPRKDKFE